MKLTEKKLRSFSPCTEGLDWYLANGSTDLKKICLDLVKQNKTHWSNWVLVRLMTLRQKRQYAIFAAEQVIDIFEKKYPEDKGPRKAIEAARVVLKNPSAKNKAAAYAAYAAASAYAASASASAASAYAASAYAAYAAAYAAYAAASAYAAAYAAADAASAAYAAATACKDLQIKIVDYGLKLLKAGK